MSRKGGLQSFCKDLYCGKRKKKTLKDGSDTTWAQQMQLFQVSLGYLCPFGHTCFGSTPPEINFLELSLSLGFILCYSLVGFRKAWI